MSTSIILSELNPTISKENLSILERRYTAYIQRGGIHDGDFILLPYGLKVRVTAIWADKIQTGFGSYHFGENGISHSGGLDSGVNRSDLIETDETFPGSCWIFDRGWPRAHAGVDCKIPFKVFRLKDGADLSGVPQVAQYEKDKFLETVETITRIDGNGRPYTLPVPVLMLIFNHTLGKTERDEITAKASACTGLNFDLVHNTVSVQPTTVSQVDALMQAFPGKHDFHNGCYYKNTLVFEFK